MNNLEKIKRQLSKPIPVKIVNSAGEEDEFMFKPLNIEQQAIMMEVGKRIQSRKMVDVEGTSVPDVSKEDMIDMGNLVEDIVRTSMPEIDEETIKDFTSTNFNQLSNVLIDLMPKENENVSLIKKKLEEANAK